MNDQLEYLANQIESKRVQLAEALADGGCDTIADYRFLTGQIRGLLTVQGYISDLAKKLETSDD